MPIIAGLLSLVFFLPGLTWGLPSRNTDRYLFGERTPWTGRELVALAGSLDANAAADVDRATDAGRWLNDTDAKRAEIVIRYRLYSQQPDEMLTLRAVASMAARRSTDPQFYTYGGLWTYPAAGLIGVASLLDIIERGDLAFYLDQPSEFAKMYVVMRLYAAAWAAIGAALMYVIVRRLTRQAWLGLAAAVTFSLLPAINIAAHEAKPHLPGAVLVLAAVAAADAYRRHGRTRHLLLAGGLSGAAAGMVVTMAVSFIVLPAAWWMRRRKTRPAMLGVACVLSVAVFVVTNPFAVLNATALGSNASNTADHYVIGLNAFDAAMGFLLYGGMFVVPIGGVVLPPLWFMRRRVRPMLVLLGLPSLVMLVAFAVTAEGRPPDHVRFALLPICMAIIVTYALIPLLSLARGRLIAVGLPIVLLVFSLVSEDRWLSEFVANVRSGGVRAEVADALTELPGGVLTVPATPAPYVVPAFDLWAWQATKGDAAPDATIWFPPKHGR